jgi:DNA-binding CsgD family transcriptional regulator
MIGDNKALKKIRSIKSLIKQEEVSNFSTEFEEKFSEINDTFYKRLNLKHPGLTPNDMKLCAFLRLNLSTKEICAITYQTPNAIDVARHRLRKKLGLGQSGNLVAELKKI